MISYGICLFLSDFTKHNLWLHSCCCKWHYFILFYGCVLVRGIYEPLFFHSSVCGLLGCLVTWLLRIVLLWTCGVCIFRIIVCPDTCPGVRLLDYMGTLFLVFCGISVLFSIVAATVYILTNSVGWFSFLHTLCSIYYL